MKIKYFIIILFIGFMGCKKKSSNPYMSEKQAIALFVDLHLADNILDVQSFKIEDKSKYGHYYNYVFKKHNISRSLFDSCLFYYAHNADEYEHIYTLVVDSLKNLKEYVYAVTSTQKSLKSDSIDIWNNSKKYYLKGDGAKKIPIKTPVKGKGEYILSLKIKVHNDDQSTNPQLEIYFADSEGESNMVPKSMNIIKDGTFHNYELKIGLSNLDYTYIEGYLLNMDNEFDYFQHIEFKDVKLLYISGF